MFRLQKWYFDCVAPDGEVFIGYRAGLRFKALELAYGGLISRHPGEKKALTRFTLAPGAAPDRSLSLSIPRLGVQGHWEAGQGPIDAILHPGVHWNCLAPRARVELGLRGRSSFAGQGYAEVMELGMAPWRLPIQELRWGRFVSDNSSLVWIDWRGSLPLTRVYLDGKLLEDAQVTDREVRGLAGGREIRLGLDTVDPLIEGKLSMTALRGIPGIKKVLPQAIRDLHQCKWLSPGTLEGAPGWIIHEVVLWP
jgi:hypothetical protein